MASLAVTPGGYAAAGATVSRDELELPGPEIRERLLQLGLGVHHERAVLGDRLAQRLAGDQDQPRAPVVEASSTVSPLDSTPIRPRASGSPGSPTSAAPS